MFDGMSCTWKTTTLDLELKDDAKPVCSRSYPVPKLHENMFKKEAKRLLRLVVLEDLNDSK